MPSGTTTHPSPSIYSIIKQPFYQFILAFLTGTILLAGTLQLAMNIDLFRRLNNDNVAMDVANILDTIYNGTDGTALVSSLHQTTIVGISSSSLLIFAVFRVIFFYIGASSKIMGQKRNFIRRKTAALLILLIAFESLVISTVTMSLYNERMGVFEGTPQICRALYDLPECRSQLSIVRHFALVIVLVLIMATAVGGFNLVAVRGYSKERKAEGQALRRSEFESERMTAIPVLKYDAGTGRKGTGTGRKGRMESID